MPSTSTLAARSHIVDRTAATQLRCGVTYKAVPVYMWPDHDALWFTVLKCCGVRPHVSQGQAGAGRHVKGQLDTLLRGCAAPSFAE